MSQQTEKPCFWCGRTEAAHETDPRPYKALMGFHEYQPAVWEPPIASPDRERPCTCATSDTPGQHHCGTPSAQLPPRQADTERARDWPTYQTGRAPAGPSFSFDDHESQPDDDNPPMPVDTLVHVHLGDMWTEEKPARIGIIRRILNAARKASQ